MHVYSLNLKWRVRMHWRQPKRSCSLQLSHTFKRATRQKCIPPTSRIGKTSLSRSGFTPKTIDYVECQDFDTPVDLHLTKRRWYGRPYVQLCKRNAASEHWYHQLLQKPVGIQLLGGSIPCGCNDWHRYPTFKCLRKQLWRRHKNQNS